MCWPSFFNKKSPNKPERVRFWYLKQGGSFGPQTTTANNIVSFYFAIIFNFFSSNYFWIPTEPCQVLSAVRILRPWAPAVASVLLRRSPASSPTSLAPPIPSLPFFSFPIFLVILHYFLSSYLLIFFLQLQLVMHLKKFHYVLIRSSAE